MHKNWIHYLFLIVVCWFTFFMHNGALYPDIMESRNFVTAREMIANDNWLIPTMNGEYRFAKPPLPTWVAAALELVSPDNVILQRAAAGLMATLMVFFLYFLVVEMSRNRLLALLSALTLATSYNVIMAARLATWDIYCHALMMGAILYFYRGLQSRGPGWGRFITAGIFLGLSFQAKGPVSFYALLLPFLLAYLPLFRPSFRRKWLPVTVMVLLCLVVGLWWWLYIYAFHQEELLSVVQRESSNWVNYNVRPWWYYYLFFAEAGLWALFLLTGLCWPWLKRKMAQRRHYTFAVLWTLFSLVLLSCMPEKKTRYLLPLLVPASIVVAHYVEYLYLAARDRLLTRADKITFRVNAFIPALIAIAMPVGLYVLFLSRGEMGWAALVIISLLFWAAVWSILVGGLQWKPLKVYTGIVIMLVLVEAFLMPRVALIFNNPDFVSIRSLRQMESVRGLSFYYPAGEVAPRIEFVYQAGRQILPRDFQRDTLADAELPVVLVSERPAAEVLPLALLSRVELQPIPLFATDPGNPQLGRRASKFIRHVTILHPKPLPSLPLPTAHLPAP